MAVSAVAAETTPGVLVTVIPKERKEASMFSKVNRLNVALLCFVTRWENMVLPLAVHASTSTVLNPAMGREMMEMLEGIWETNSLSSLPI
jgi:hypothetical protein